MGDLCTCPPPIALSLDVSHSAAEFSRANTNISLCVSVFDTVPAPQITDLLFLFPLCAVVLLVRWLFTDAGSQAVHIQASSSYNPHKNDTPAWREREREIERERKEEQERERRERERELEERKWSKGV